LTTRSFANNVTVILRLLLQLHVVHIAAIAVPRNCWIVVAGAQC